MRKITLTVWLGVALASLSTGCYESQLTIAGASQGNAILGNISARIEFIAADALNENPVSSDLVFEWDAESVGASFDSIAWNVLFMDSSTLDYLPEPGVCYPNLVNGFPLTLQATAADFTQGELRVPLAIPPGYMSNPYAMTPLIKHEAGYTLENGDFVSLSQNDCLFAVSFGDMMLEPVEFMMPAD